MSVNQRRKGSTGEKMLISFLEDWSGLDFKRSPQSGGLRGHVVDYTVGDIICTDQSFKSKIFPMTIECKRYKEIDFSTLILRPSPRGNTVKCVVDDWWDQANEDGLRGERVPLLFMRYDKLPKDFFYLVIDRKLAKYLVFPKDRLVTRKYLICSTWSLKNEIKWGYFFKSVNELWQSMYG